MVGFETAPQVVLQNGYWANGKRTQQQSREHPFFVVGFILNGPASNEVEAKKKRNQPRSGLVSQGFPDESERLFMAVGIEVAVRLHDASRTVTTKLAGRLAISILHPARPHLPTPKAKPKDLQQLEDHLSHSFRPIQQIRPAAGKKGVLLSVCHAETGR